MKNYQICIIKEIFLSSRLSRQYNVGTYYGFKNIKTQGIGFF